VRGREGGADETLNVPFFVYSVCNLIKGQ
jgi:hypothetical protein